MRHNIMTGAGSLFLVYIPLFITREFSLTIENINKLLYVTTQFIYISLIFNPQILLFTIYSFALNQEKVECQMP